MFPGHVKKSEHQTHTDLDRKDLDRKPRDRNQITVQILGTGLSDILSDISAANISPVTPEAAASAEPTRKDRGGSTTAGN